MLGIFKDEGREFAPLGGNPFGKIRSRRSDILIINSP